MGWVARFMAADRKVRVIAADVTDEVNHTAQIHELGRASSQLGAECSAALAVLSAYVKGEDKVVVQVQGEQPRFSYFGDLDGLGGFRARVTPSRCPGKPDLDAVRGVIMVQKHDGERELYRGMTPIDGTSIGQALRDHFASSNQVEGLLQLSATRASDGTFQRAGAVWVERMPGDDGTDALSTSEFQDRFGAIADTSLSALLDGMAFGAMLGEPLEPLEVSEIRWESRMSVEKVEAMLRTLGPDTLRTMLEEDGGAEVIDQFSRMVFTITAERLAELIAEIGG